ncbi:hypothetical protein E2C01_055849 [Portunus trituberculatus]|uniref:Uncharacterized protein n=1 Tax=Portunus trituberculatus TaxID=210409 RepID=A0A5B7GVV2_PORTR|nr:hypothetical protein [Portunus trituberculatus]
MVSHNGVEKATTECPEQTNTVRVTQRPSSTCWLLHHYYRQVYRGCTTIILKDSFSYHHNVGRALDQILSERTTQATAADNTFILTFHCVCTPI